MSSSCTAEDERAERARAAALAPRVAGDHELLPAVRLDLQPVARAAALAVAASRPAWRRSPRSPAPARPRAERLAVLERLGELDAAAAAVEQRARAAARRSRERQVDERLAVDLEHVERDVDVRRPGRRPAASRRSSPGRPRRARTTSPSRTQSGVRTAPCERARDGREAPGQVVVGAAAELALAAADVRDRAVAVPLDLVEPARRRRDLLGERGEHRPVAVRRADLVAPSHLARCSSRLRISSQFFGSPSSFAGTSVHVPSSRSPWSRTVRPPSRFSSTSSYVPRSQISTVPAPYFPAGISPSKVA